ncbi:MAG: hypothetical protein ACRD4H_04705 [Candidatus Acidiferrales bacterium]
MQNMMIILAFTVGLSGGLIAGHYEGVATTLQAQVSYQTAFAAALAEPIEGGHRHKTK